MLGGRVGRGASRDRIETTGYQVTGCLNLASGLDTCTCVHVQVYLPRSAGLLDQRNASEINCQVARKEIRGLACVIRSYATKIERHGKESILISAPQPLYGE